MTKVALLVINLDNYDRLIPPPFDRTSCDITTFYITDNEEDMDRLTVLGWDNIKCVSSQRRRPHIPWNCVLVDYKLYPEKVFPELLNYDILVSIDASVIRLSGNFLNKYIYSVGEHSLLLDDMYYGPEPQPRNNISEEFDGSVTQPRWSMAVESMNEAKKRYIDEGFDLQTIKVCSAKYVVINMRKKTRNSHIWDFLASEYETHLQGNIIYSIASKKFSEDIIVSSTLDKSYANAVNESTWGQHGR